MSTVPIYSSDNGESKTISDILSDIKGFVFNQIWVKSELWTLPLNEVDSILFNSQVEKTDFDANLGEFTLILYPFDEDSLFEEMAFWDECGEE